MRAAPFPVPGGLRRLRCVLSGLPRCGLALSGVDTFPRIRRALASAPRGVEPPGAVWARGRDRHGFLHGIQCAARPRPWTRRTGRVPRLVPARARPAFLPEQALDLRGSPRDERAARRRIPVFRRRDVSDPMAGLHAAARALRHSGMGCRRRRECGSDDGELLVPEAQGVQGRAAPGLRCGGRPPDRSGGGSREEVSALRSPRSVLPAAALALAASVLFYAWTVSTTGYRLEFLGPKRDYYNLLAQGFRKGHLYMDAAPDPALLALPPSERPGNAPYLLDASLYRDRYYIYFGVVPVVLLYLPYAALTGQGLPEAAAALFFASAGLVFATLWWFDARRRLFPGSGGAWAFASILGISIGSAVAS